MKLFGAPLSPYVRKARIVAAEKNLDYEYDPKPSPVTGWDDYFLAINPMKRIPALLPDASRPDFAINDSSAICGYFEKLQPTPAFYPSAAEDYGRALWLEEVADTELASKIGLGVFRPVLFNLFSGKPANYDEADAGFAELSTVLFPYLENACAGDYFVGDAFSIADLAIATQIINLQYVGYGVPQEAFPRLAASVAKTIARPSVAAFVEKDKAFFAKMGMDLPSRL